MLTIQRLSYEDAVLLISGAEAKAQKIKVPMCIAVVDESGYLIAFKRMDHGKPLSTTLAQDKAYTAAISKKATADYNAAAVPGNLTNGIQMAAGGRFSTVGGGIPVTVDGVVVGAIGLSGGAPEQDIACAKAGIKAFRKVNPDCQADLT
ncbi:MAG: heme-binding protein [Rhodospirillales bacterium]